MLRDLAPLAAAGIVIACSAADVSGQLPILAAAVVLAACWRRSSRSLAFLTAGFLSLAALLEFRSASELDPLAEDAHLQEAQLAAVRGRAQELIQRLTTAAARAAALPEARQALTAKPDARAPLFRALERLRQESGPGIALAVHGVDWSAAAWTGRIVELVPFRSLIAGREDVFVVEGSVSTALVATVAVKPPKGAPLGYATAEITVATHRNVENEYLRDYDLFAAGSRQVELRYVDLRDRSPSEHAFPPLPDGAQSRTELLRGPAGNPVAVVRVTPPHAQAGHADKRSQQRRLLCTGFTLLLLGWLTFAPASGARLALGATLLRGAMLTLGVPWPEPSSRLLSAEVYSARAPAAAPLAWLGALARSPLDLLLTAAWLLLLSALLLSWALARAPRRVSPWRAALADVLSVPILAATFLAVFAVVSHCSLDLQDIAILPSSATPLAMQAALLLLLATGGALAASVLTLAGPFPDGLRTTALRLLGWLAVLAAAFEVWPRERLGLPLLPALVLFAGAALLAGGGQRLRERLHAASLEAHAGLALATVAALATLLFPSVLHYDEKNLRAAIERSHAPQVLRQPEWRDYVLRQARRTIDEYGVLESEPTGPHPPEIEELAYAVWSATQLASLGVTSAVEIQNPSGAIVSRFALNLPSLGGNRRALPRSAEWAVSRERSTVASAERPVLHAQRLLVYDGVVRGAVHVFVGDDYWNLPFLRSRDPYTVLYRRAGEGFAATRPLGLLVYDQTLANVFSSDERPPALEPPLAERVRAAPLGLWTTLLVDGQKQHAFLRADEGFVYAVYYPRAGAGRYLADLLEAVLSLTLLALLLLAATVAARTLLRRDDLSLPSLRALMRRRFALRLFVAFMLVAMAPMLVLQSVVERFVVERLRRDAGAQALELAGVAKKAVEDFALFQRDEAPDQPVTDAALVWVASLIRNDLDVFERGRLLASSKRELYASGLLPQRLSGDVYLAIVLENQTSALRTERIGSFSYQVVSVPLRFGSGGPRVLQIPLALRQAEVEAVVEDLRRSLRLFSLVFLAAAAGLAVSMSRRISGPLRALTVATQRVAAGDFEARVVATTHDELADLVGSFNRMSRELVRQRRDLERTNRLAAWAEMAREVAHEVKNPLTPIQLAAEHLRRVFADRSSDFAGTLESCTGTILKQVGRLRGIVTEFSSFARPPAQSLERVELGPLVSEVARSYQEVLPEQVTLEVGLADQAPAVAADRRLLERALVNLVENALQAVGEKGAVRLRVERSQEGHAVIDVEDSGPGLDPEARTRIFEPFFSTKASGSGLGLALVKKIAEDHGGGVSIDSRPGEPTRARLWFPAAGELAEQRAPDSSLAAAAQAPSTAAAASQPATGASDAGAAAPEAEQPAAGSRYQ